jgi:hypothetical protein
LCLVFDREIEHMHINIPKEAGHIIEVFENNGYEAYVVGGCVRDSVLGRKPEDWDITTSAKPEEMKKLFKRTIDTGIQHGTVTIRMNGCNYETTTFRIDGEYEDGRHPKEVSFTSLLSEDLRRRDFTINAMAYCPGKGIIDLFGGIDDLDKKIIRCVGDARERFGEDALRTLRAVRFAGQLGFVIEEETYNAIKELSDNIDKISAERIRVEITKLLISKGPDRMFVAKDTCLTRHFMPEWDKMCQEGYGDKIIKSINYINEHISEEKRGQREHKALCFAVLLMKSDNAKDVMKRLKFDNYSIEMVDRLARLHDVEFATDKPSFRKFLNEAGVDIMPYLFELRRAYFKGFYDDKDQSGKSLTDRDGEAENMLKEIMSAGDAIYVKDLKISGKDVMSHGVPAGKMVGIILNTLLEEVLENPEKNDEKLLIERAVELSQSNF